MLHKDVDISKLNISLPNNMNDELIIKFKGDEYKFKQSITDNMFTLYYNDNTIHNNHVRVTILNGTTIAKIECIGNYITCSKHKNKCNGSLLLKLTIKMLKKYKKRFNINAIILTDISIKKCNGGNILLAKMLVLITGDTWYGKYNFKPYNIYTGQINNILYKKYKKNKKIMNKITITNIDILKYIKLTNNEKLILDTIDILNFKPNTLLKDFLIDFLKKYDETCQYFSMFYEILYKKLKLTNFHRQEFILFL